VIFRPISPFFLALISSFAIWLQSSSIGSKIGGSRGSKGVSEGFLLDFVVGGGFVEALDVLEGFLGVVGGFLGAAEGFLGALEGFEGPEDCTISSK
jgi:hypothetical protein